jgi:hypothetical protein
MRSNSASEGKLFSDKSPFVLGVFFADLAGAAAAEADAAFDAGLADVAVFNVAPLELGTALVAFVAGVFFEGMETLRGVEVLAGATAFAGAFLTEVVTLAGVAVLAGADLLAGIAGLDFAGAAFFAAAV